MDGRGRAKLRTCRWPACGRTRRSGWPHRIPRLGWETDHRTIPAEAGFLAPAVHLDKGCYRGQETVARVHHLGRPPRRLVLLHLDGIATDQPPRAGHPGDCRTGGRSVSSAPRVRHHELGMVALAVVKRNVADDAPLLVAESAAADRRP